MKSCSPGLLHHHDRLLHKLYAWFNRVATIYIYMHSLIILSSLVSCSLQFTATHYHNQKHSWKSIQSWIRFPPTIQTTITTTPQTRGQIPDRKKMLSVQEQAARMKMVTWRCLVISKTMASLWLCSLWVLRDGCCVNAVCVKRGSFRYYPRVPWLSFPLPFPINKFKVDVHRHKSWCISFSPIASELNYQDHQLLFYVILKT